MFLRQIVDPYLAQNAYLVGCQKTGECLVIDPERDVERYRAIARENGLRITAVAETHIHADFVSGAQELSADPDMRVYVSGEGEPDWTSRWAQNRPNTFVLRDQETFQVGNIEIQAIHTPGHTPEHLSYLITDQGGGADAPMAVISGDFLFVGDVGRPDLLESAAGMAGVMESSARDLQKALVASLAGMEDSLIVLPAHGAGSACGKALGAVPFSSLGYERRFNRPFRQAQEDEAGFVREILRGQPEPPRYFATMKRVNRDGIRITGGCPPVRHLAFNEAHPLAIDEGVAILDTRDSREAFSSGHIPNALHVPLHGPFFSAGAGSYVGEMQPVLLVAENEEDATLAAMQLYRIGLDGLQGWISTSEWVGGGGELSRVERVLFDQFDAAQAGRDGVILDVRTRAEFAEGHLEGAVSVPYTLLKERLKELPSGRRIFVHCGSGKRAAVAASLLAARGFDAIHIDGVCEECERIANAHQITH